MPGLSIFLPKFFIVWQKNKLVRLFLLKLANHLGPAFTLLLIVGLIHPEVKGD